MSTSSPVQAEAVKALGHLRAVWTDGELDAAILVFALYGLSVVRVKPVNWLMPAWICRNIFLWVVVSILRTYIRCKRPGTLWFFKTIDLPSGTLWRLNHIFAFMCLVPVMLGLKLWVLQPCHEIA
jgi:hypothetical protein